MTGKRQTFDVFVGNLPHDTVEKSLSPLFTEVGEVSSIRIINSRKPDNSKIAYVKYFFESDAEAAVSQRNGYQFGNSTLLVHRTKGSSQSRRTPEPAMAEVTEPESKQKVLKALLAAQSKTATHTGPAPRPPISLGGSDEQMVVCEVKDVTSFFAQRMADVDRAIQLGNELAEFCLHAKPLEESPEFRKMYAARFSQDQNWYRCRILQKLDASRSVAQYVDYGNCEQVPDSALVLLTGQLAEIPPLALHCRLDSLTGVRRDDNPHRYAQAMSHVQNLLQDQVVLVQLKKTVATSTYFLTRCIVANGGIDLVQELLTKGFAKCQSISNQPFGHWEGVGSRGIPPRPPAGAPPLAAWAGNPWMAPTRHQDARFSDGNRGRGDQRTGLWYPDMDRSRAYEPRVHEQPRSSDPKIPDLKMQDPRAQELRGPNPREGKRVLSPDHSSLVRRLSAERDSLKAQLLKTELRVRALELQVAEHGPKCSSLNFLSRLSQVLGCVEESRLQRERFSVGGPDDVLEQALCALGSCPSGEGSCFELQTTLDRYHQSQDAIKACPDTASLEPLKLERDATRSKLVQELQAELEALDPDRLHDHVLLIVANLENLMRVYGDFLGTSPPSPSDDSLEDVLELLAQHKMKRADDFRNKREATDKAREHFVDALQALQQAVQLGPPVPGPEGHRFSLTYLEACLSNLHHSIQDELAACNLAVSAQQSPLAQLVWRVQGLLRRYLEQASTGSAMVVQHKALLEELQPLDWDATHCMARAATEAKRALRKLKSQLRHRLADFDDLESGDEEERQRVSEEIAKLRQEVQLALSQEEPMLDMLAHEQRKHFPELDKLFPDLQLELHQRYAGLVKSSWELSSFELEGSTLETTFLGEKMLLREFAIDGPESKELLLTKAARFALVSCKHLISIKAAFLSKNERHIYLMVPRPAPTLSERTWAPCHARKALQHVLQALHELHEAPGGPIAHGAVHPETVRFEHQSEEAILDLPFHALRSVGRGLQSLGGIDFVAPELRGGAFCQPTPAGDMYSLGCLALWMLFPGALFKQTSRGIPDTSMLMSADQPELATIPCLLSAEPRERLTAKEALATAFFLSALYNADPVQEADASPSADNSNECSTISDGASQDTTVAKEILLHAIESVAVTVSEDTPPEVLHEMPPALQGAHLVDTCPQIPSREYVAEAVHVGTPAVADEGAPQDLPQVEHRDTVPPEEVLPEDCKDEKSLDTSPDVAATRQTVADVLSFTGSTKTKDWSELSKDCTLHLEHNGDCSQPVEQLPEAREHNDVGNQVDGTRCPPLEEDQRSANDSFGE